MRSSWTATLLALLALAGASGAEERVRLFPCETSVLELEGFRVFHEGAQVVVQGANGATRSEPVPATRYFRGAVRGEPGSLAMIAVEPDGRRRGLVHARGQRFILMGLGTSWAVRREPDPGPAAARDRCAATDAARSFGGPEALLPLTPDLPRGPGGPTLAAVVAVETDWELFSTLGSVEAVATHVGDLFATVAAVYRRDLDIDVQVGDLFVWAVPEDPFFVQSSFLDALYELGDHWHAEHAGVARTLVHLVSGKAGILGGIGYHGVLCRADTPVAGHWGGGYSLSGAHATLGAFRDAFITAHELGHNFRAYHTHCFNDLPLPGDPEIDRCTSGEVRNDGHPCYAGPESLPADGGSIMSYCHLLAGGYANVTLALGAPDAFGTHSERVIERMRAHVESVSCLVPVEPPLFADDFELGDLSHWSLTVP